MTKTLYSAAAAVSLAASFLTAGSDPAAAHRRGRVVAVPAPAVVDVGYASNGCGYRASACAPRDCRPYGYYDMSYSYVIPSMTPTFGYREPVRRCWF